MRQNGIIGLGSGKLGSTISSVRGGVQIQREHRSSIANPSTEGQVAQRARIKLMSQIGAALNAIIAIPPMKLHTSRNLFSKANIGFVEVNDGVASIDYAKIQLTSSSFGCPSVIIARTRNSGIQVNLSSDARGCCNTVVYNLVKVNTNDKLQVVDSVVVTNAGEEGFFDYMFPYIDGRLVVYAYGIRLNSTKARAKYAAYRINNGRDVASLVISRKIASPDFRVTCTVAATDEPMSTWPVISHVNNMTVVDGHVALSDEIEAIILQGRNFFGEEWTLRNAFEGTIISSGIVAEHGVQVTFNFAEIGTWYVFYGEAYMLKVVISPYGCYIYNVNGTPASVREQVSVARAAGRIVVNGRGFAGTWVMRNYGSPAFYEQGTLSSNYKSVTFTAPPTGDVYITCDNKEILYLNITS